MLVNQIAWQCQSLKASFKVSVFSLEDHSLLIQECSKMYLLEHQFLSNSWKTIFSWPNMFGKWCKLFFFLGGWQYTSTSKVLSSPTIKKFAIFCFTQHSPNLLAHQTLFSRTYKHQEEWMCWGAYVGKCCSKEMLKLAFFTAVQVSEVPAWRCHCLCPCITSASLRPQTTSQVSFFHDPLHLESSPKFFLIWEIPSIFNSCIEERWFPESSDWSGCFGLWLFLQDIFETQGMQSQNLIIVFQHQNYFRYIVYSMYNYTYWRKDIFFINEEYHRWRIFF